MKILMINSVCGIRSTGRICTDLADILKEHGHECLIAYGRETVPEKYENISYRIGSDADVKLHALSARLFDNAGFCSRKATKKLIKKIREYDPDVIHLHNLHGYYLDVEALFDYLKKSGKPVVWTLHDCWAFTGHCAHFDAVGCNKWKTGCHHCPQKREYPTSFLFDNSKKNYADKKRLFTQVENLTPVTPSGWLAGIVRESFLGKYDIKVIPNGIDLDIFKPTNSDFRKKYGLENKKIILGVASAWDKRKGLDDFVSLSALLDESYAVVLVGIDEKQKCALPKNIIAISKTNNALELAEVYSAADVFVNPSRQETMGLTTVEAMACGTPVAVSDLTAVPEVVTSDGGLILPALTPEKIRDGIENVLKAKFDPRKNAEIFEKKRQFMRYLALYDSVLKQ